MIEKHWYSRKKTILSAILEPASYIFSKIASHRKKNLQEKQYKSKIPIIIVGNISVGGTGKTPVVRALSEYFLAEGKKPAIISRGYGAKADTYPFEVDENTKPSQCGDEPCMMHDALQGKVPIIIDANRARAIKFIEEKYSNIDVIISDDGLQHYKIARDYELVVVDASRMFGNGLTFPAGPLRESIDRIKEVDAVIAIGNCKDEDKKLLQEFNKNILFTKIIPKEFINIKTGERKSLSEFNRINLTAIVGIGNPQKFFNSLEELGVVVTKRKIFKDHYKFKESDFIEFDGDDVIVMTYKDAVKCKDFAKENWWYLDISVELCFEKIGFSI
ncbi:tetraacyldisaccharide 4'-kinase [Pseudofrancisella aestuarii]|uniref:Tetraacyldisaccharide 4'-kinase n=1 Tax=Pseudofrancisella aestuarii TaxID=2670347 RepID=A0ABV9TCY4_9GAMM|nr:tetraacyldisaccharide 4'-kinase [Pseudofrancisella aestuarii]